MAREHVTLLIPVLNEERTIPELANRIPGVLEPIDVEWSVIFIDDGSRDGTTQVRVQCPEPGVQARP